MPVVHLVGETPELAIQVARAIKGQSAGLKPVLATVLLDVPGNTSTRGINVHKTGNYPSPRMVLWNNVHKRSSRIDIGRNHRHRRISRANCSWRISEGLNFCCGDISLLPLKSSLFPKPTLIKRGQDFIQRSATSPGHCNEEYVNLHGFHLLKRALL